MSANRSPLVDVLRCCGSSRHFSRSPTRKPTPPRIHPTHFLPRPSVPSLSVTGLSDADCSTEAFIDFFSGDVGAVPGMTSWATPYALAIMGTPMVRQCPFKDGTGYGDGRAVSMGEVVVDGKRWEMQLKGGGTTPFSRGADGRAVLRSSVREFLASEAMHGLGVPTTRALSLIVSESETVQRPWFVAASTSALCPRPCGGGGGVVGCEHDRAAPRVAFMHLDRH